MSRFEKACVIVLAAVFVALWAMDEIQMSYVRKAYAEPVFKGLGPIGAARGGVDPAPTVVMPAHDPGDIIIVMSYTRGATVGFDPPAGYADVTGSPFGSTYRVWWKEAATNAESDITFGVGVPPVDAYAIAYVIERATKDETPMEVVSGAQTGSTNPAVIPGFTTLSDENLIVVASGGDDRVNASCSVTGVDPAEYDESYVETNVGADFSFCFAQMTQPVAGDTGSVSITYDVAAPNWGAIFMGIKPPITRTKRSGMGVGS